MDYSNKKLMWLGLLFILAGTVLYVTQEAQDSVQVQPDVLPAVPLPFENKQASDGRFPAHVVPSYLLPLIISHSVEKAAELLASLPIEDAERIIKEIIDDEKSPLTRDDKIQFLSDLAFLHKSDPEKQARFFKILVDNKQFHEGEPLLFAVAAGDYQKVIPDFLQWLEKYNPTIVKVVTQDAVNYAIEYNRFTEFERLQNYGIFIPPHQATTLLWEVVDRNDDARFLPILIGAGADVNAIYDKKYTPLIRATMLNNLKSVKTLLEAGAKVDLIPDPAVGSALQIAVVKQFGPIDLLLRNYGARE